jgi:glycosyltransferase involved in cell wall biosynthesis
VQPGDAAAMARTIQYLYQSPDTCKKMGIHGRVYVEDHYDRQKSAEQLLNAFLQVKKSYE